MAQREKGGRVVFIGNIPYGVSEEQICDIFGQVGRVVNFRLVYDKETGRPKGFGFLEYTDVDAAASAVRNLNEHEIMGRTLRVDYSNDNGGGAKGGGGGGADVDSNRTLPPAHFNPPAQANGGDSAALPSLPPGVEAPPGLTAPDAISQTLSKIPAAQLLDILSQMKHLVSTNPAQATTLLAQAPQLSYAIFQALLLLGLVDTNVLGSLIQQTAASAPPPAQPPAPPQQQPLMSYGQPPPPSMPPQPNYPYGALPPPSYPHPPPPAAYAPTPPAPQPAYPPPPPLHPQPQPAAAPMMPADPSQAALIQQVLTMPMEQIMALDEVPRSQILSLRAQYGGMAVR